MKAELVISAILVLVVAVVFIAIRIILHRLDNWAKAMILSYDWGPLLEQGLPPNIDQEQEKGTEQAIGARTFYRSGPKCALAPFSPAQNGP